MSLGKKIFCIITLMNSVHILSSSCFMGDVQNSIKSNNPSIQFKVKPGMDKSSLTVEIIGLEPQRNRKVSEISMNIPGQTIDIRGTNGTLTIFSHENRISYVFKNKISEEIRSNNSFQTSQSSTTESGNQLIEKKIDWNKGIFFEYDAANNLLSLTFSTIGAI